jgi:LexA-binding, inner membrane-associated putative hydrolase
MMAVGHGYSGADTGLYVCLAAGMSLGVTLLVTAASAGAAILSDADHHGSTFTTSFGRITWLVHRGVVRLHYLVAEATWDPGEREPGAHRGLTHWWPFPLATGVIVGVPSVIWPPVAVVVLALLTFLGVLSMVIPEYRDDPEADPGRRVALSWAHWIVDLFPHTAYLRWMRRRINRRRQLSSLWPFRVLLRRNRYRDSWLTWHAKGAARWVLRRVRGRFLRLTLLLGSGAMAWHVVAHHYWVGWLVGPIVAGGMLLHMMGDAPTWSRIPGWTLRGKMPWPTSVTIPLWRWRLTVPTSFRAGGPFEVIGLWIPLSALAMVGLWFAAWPAVSPLVHGLVESLSMWAA